MPVLRLPVRVLPGPPHFIQHLDLEALQQTLHLAPRVKGPRHPVGDTRPVVMHPEQLTREPPSLTHPPRHPRPQPREVLRPRVRNRKRRIHQVEHPWRNREILKRLHRAPQERPQLFRRPFVQPPDPLRVAVDRQHAPPAPQHLQRLPTIPAPQVERHPPGVRVARARPRNMRQPLSHPRACDRLLPRRFRLLRIKAIERHQQRLPHRQAPRGVKVRWPVACARRHLPPRCERFSRAGLHITTFKLVTLGHTLA